MLQTNNNESLYYGMIEINEELFKRIEKPQSNSTRLLTIKGTDKPKNSIPYFLRTDQEEITLENSKNNGIRQIFYIPSMQEDAQKLYDIIKSHKEIYKEKPFYIYYAYAFIHTSTQAQIAESKLIVLGYDLHTSFENLIL